MGAVPKTRISKGRKNRRRTHQKLKVTGLVECEYCGHKKKQHRVCPNCGKYKAKEVIKTD